MKQKTKGSEPNNQNDEGRERQSKFGEHPNSVRGQMYKMTPQQRALFEKNQSEYKQDAVAMELWAAGDFLSGLSQTDNYSAFEKGEDD